MNNPEQPVVATPSPVTTEEPPLPPMRPIAPEVQELLNRGYQMQRILGEIRVYLEESIAVVTTGYPEYLSQIAGILEGHAQRLNREAHAANLARRKHVR